MITTTLACPASSVLPERFAVEVTADDIAHGCPSWADKCPIALAVMRGLRNQKITFVTVTVTSVEVAIKLDWHTPSPRYWHDSESWVHDFDRGNAVEPRTVVLARLP